MDIKGKHFIIDGFECNSLHLNNIAFLEKLCKKAAIDAGMEIINSYFHQFQPQGVTGMLVLSTSHISIHTWPEERYASFDFYTCGNPDLIAAPVYFLLKELSTKKAMLYSIPRGIPHPQHIKCDEIITFDSSEGENTT